MTTRNGRNNTMMSLQNRLLVRVLPHPHAPKIPTRRGRRDGKWTSCPRHGVADDREDRASNESTSLVDVSNNRNHQQNEHDDPAWSSSSCCCWRTWSDSLVVVVVVGTSTMTLIGLPMNAKATGSIVDRPIPIPFLCLSGVSCLKERTENVYSKKVPNGFLFLFTAAPRYDLDGRRFVVAIESLIVSVKRDLQCRFEELENAKRVSTPTANSVACSWCCRRLGRSTRLTENAKLLWCLNDERR